MYATRRYMLKPQDILVLLALIGRGRSEWDFAGLSTELSISLSALHRALKRLGQSQLYSVERGAVRVHNTHEFLVHAVRYLVPLTEGAIATGFPTGASAEPLSAGLVGVDSEAVDSRWVWAHPAGSVRGISIEPITPTVPKVIQADAALYRRLAALDALRGGRARDRRAADEWFRHELGLL